MDSAYENASMTSERMNKTPSTPASLRTHADRFSLDTFIEYNTTCTDFSRFYWGNKCVSMMSTVAELVISLVHCCTVGSSDGLAVTGILFTDLVKHRNNNQLRDQECHGADLQAQRCEQQCTK